MINYPKLNQKLSFSKDYILALCQGKLDMLIKNQEELKEITVKKLMNKPRFKWFFIFPIPINKWDIQRAEKEWYESKSNGECFGDCWRSTRNYNNDQIAKAKSYINWINDSENTEKFELDDDEYYSLSYWKHN